MTFKEMRSEPKPFLAINPSHCRAITAGSGDLAGRWFFTHDGVLAVVGEEVGKVGFGVAASLTVTRTLLESVDNLNRLMRFGHFWLSPGDGDANWSLVCGFKFPYDGCSEEFVIDLCVALVQHSSTIVAAARREISSEDHRQYWLDDATPLSQALVLASHLA